MHSNSYKPYHLLDEGIRVERVVADLEGPLERPLALRVVRCRVFVLGAQAGARGLSLMADLLEAWLREPSRLVRLVRLVGLKCA